jgi:hypothetical protein
VNCSNNSNIETEQSHSPKAAQLDCGSRPQLWLGDECDRSVSRVSPRYVVSGLSVSHVVSSLCAWIIH